MRLYDTIDDTARQIATRLGPEGVDRDLVQPVAAFALWSMTDARVAMVRADDSSHSYTFPLAQQEIPVITGKDRDTVGRQLADFIRPAMQALDVPYWRVARITSLNMRARGLDRLPVVTAANDQRSRLTFPFAVGINGRPHIAHGTWFEPGDARLLLHARRQAQLSDQIMLESLLSSPIARAPKSASHTTQWDVYPAHYVRARRSL